MTIKETSSLRPRIIQILCTLIDFVLLFLATFNVGFCIGENSNLPNRVSILNKLASEKLGDDANIEPIDMETSYLLDLTLVLILIVNILSVITSFMIALSVTMEHKIFLSLTSVFSALLFVGCVCSCVLCFIVKEKSNVMVGNAFFRGVKSYTTLPELDLRDLSLYYNHLVDIVQHKGKCCGYKAYSEYFEYFPLVKYDSKNTTFYACAAKDFPQNVPFSCCRIHKQRDDEALYKTCVTGLHVVGSCQKNPDSAKVQIFTDSCNSKMGELNANLDIIARFFLLQSSIFLSQTIMILYLTFKYVESPKGKDKTEKIALTELGLKTDEQKGFDGKSQSNGTQKSQKTAKTQSTMNNVKNKKHARR